MKTLLLALALLLLAGCSATKEPSAYGAIAADEATTAIGLSQGLTELNPIAWAATPLSIAAVEYAYTLPAEEGTPIIHMVRSSKWGISASNLLMIAGLGPVSFFAGGVVGALIWTSGADEREYAYWCAEWMATPGNTCLPFKAPA